MDIVERLFDLVDKKYREQRDFAADLGLPASVISEWRRRRSASFNKRLPQIAEVLGTTVGYLLTGENEKSAPATKTGGESALGRKVISGLMELTPEELEKVDAFVQGLRAAR